MITPRERGNQLESFVLVALPDAKKTAGSGSVRGDGDIHVQDFYVECKRKAGLEGLSITKKEMKKALQQALKTGRIPVFIIRNNTYVRDWACIPMHCLQEYLELRAQARQDA